MTARDVFEALLTELSKVNAPPMLLQDYNYFINKAINLYVNKRYNIYDVNLQTTDDLRVLKSTAILDVNKLDANELNDYGAGSSRIFGGTYEFVMPTDYLHMLNCICVYKVNGRYKCYNDGDYVQFSAKRLDADRWSLIINDYYNRPLPERPYYYIHHVNSSVEVPTNPINDNTILARNTKGTDAKIDYTNSTSEIIYVYKYKTDEGEYTNEDIFNENNEISNFKEKNPDSIIIETVAKKSNATNGSNLPRTISLKGISNKSLIEKEAGLRYGNATNVRCEIRYGHDNSTFKLVKVLVDYLKVPQYIRLTQEQVNLTQDTSLIMEFPDYVCLEIINELVTLVMENIGDPRLLTHIPVTQSIALPTQQLAQPTAYPKRRASN